MNKLMTTPVVKTAMKSDEAGVIDALKLAFVADPSLAKAFGGKAFEHESAHYVEAAGDSIFIGR
jgi:hypothetical protein